MPTDIFRNACIDLMSSGRTVDVLALGESWFHDPFDNLTNPLCEVLERPAVCVIGENRARRRARSRPAAAALHPHAGRAADDQARVHRRGRQRLRGARRSRRSPAAARSQRSRLACRLLSHGGTRRRREPGRRGVSGPDRRGQRAPAGRVGPPARMRRHDSARQGRAGPQVLARAADGQRAGAHAGRAARGPAPRDRARVDRPLHARAARPRDRGKRYLGGRGRGRLVGRRARGQPVGERALPDTARLRADRAAVLVGTCAARARLALTAVQRAVRRRAAPRAARAGATTGSAHSTSAAKRAARKSTKARTLAER